MKITTKEQAFQVLDNNQYGIPFDAIEFLYNHPTDDAILNKIQVVFEKAPSDYYYNEELQRHSFVELWYAIVAENHLDLKLLDAMIGLLTEETYGEEFISEQASVLITLMSKKYGATVIDKVLASIEEVFKDDSILAPFEYLFEALFYADEQKHRAPILRILEHYENEDTVQMAAILCYAGFKSFLPDLKKLAKYHKKEAKIDPYHLYHLEPLAEAIQHLEQDPSTVTKVKPYPELRGHWKAYYQEYEGSFEEDYQEEEEDYQEQELNRFLLEQLAFEALNESNYQEIETVKNVQKVGRNEPCPCGSGKKYKKCCLKNK